MTTTDMILDITQLVYGGNGMGRAQDGKAVFVPGVLPGEKVRVQLVTERRGYAHAKLLEILEPVEERIQPRCPHFGICGGCHYQHIPYPAQLKYKQAILREQFSRLGNFPDAPIREIVPSPIEFNYRNSLQFHVSSQGKLGFQAAGSNRVIDIDQCQIAHVDIEETRRNFEFETLPGLQVVELRCGYDHDVLMLLESNQEILPNFETESSISAIFRGPNGDVLLAGSDTLLQEIKGRTFLVSAGSFFQVNLAATEKMLSCVFSQINLSKNSVLMDIYCGVGLFSAFVAPHVGKCIGIESSPSACRDYAVNLDPFDNVELYQGDAETILPLLVVEPDIIIVDPPRSGLGDEMTQSIINHKPQTLVYVSCDPSTLARDARLLVDGGYKLTEVTPFDFFPQTYHMETVSLFTH